jgi:hypothetical protein
VRHDRNRLPHIRNRLRHFARAGPCLNPPVNLRQSSLRTICVRPRHRHSNAHARLPT